MAMRTLGARIVYSHLRDHLNTQAGVDTTYRGGGILHLRDVLAEFAQLPQRVIHCFELGGGGGDPEG